MGRSTARELPLDHVCAWRDEAEELRQQVAELTAQMQALQRHVFGKRSEKMPPVAKELRDRGGPGPDPAASKEKRRKRAEARKELPTREIRHEVPENDQSCPKCGGETFSAVGEGKKSVLYELIPPRFERQVHVQETLACKCGDHIVTAEAPPRPVEGGMYGPRLIAHAITAKCADSIPLHRLAKALERAGIPIARSTLVDLFHRAAEELAPLSRLLIEEIARQEVVHADETPAKVQAPKKTRTGYIWAFMALLNDPLLGYIFSPSRSGDTPMRVLGGSEGALVVDAYSGYNKVTSPEGRTRVGCWAHVRRKFYDASFHQEEAKWAIEKILELYRVEAQARNEQIVRTHAHGVLRRERAGPATEDLKEWLIKQEPLHPPKSPLGNAIRYTLKQWEALTEYLGDPRLPIDNNPAERALRVVALGRKNFLFVGNDQAGQNLAGLYSLVATCIANEINPEEYLADVLLRVKAHPNSRILDLLPPQWKRLRDGEETRAPSAA